MESRQVKLVELESTAKESSNKKYHCEHGRSKYFCKECGGSQICPHGKRKSYCKECDGSQICSHRKIKSRCKECSNSIGVFVKNWLYDARQSDRRHDRYDADRFIDKCFLEGLIEDYEACYYEDCKVKLQYVEFQDDLATIERLDNSIGHIKSNCVLCCLKCNDLKKSNLTSGV